MQHFWKEAQIRSRCHLQSWKFMVIIIFPCRETYFLREDSGPRKRATGVLTPGLIHLNLRWNYEIPNDTAPASTAPWRTKKTHTVSSDSGKRAQRRHRSTRVCSCDRHRSHGRVPEPYQKSQSLSSLRQSLQAHRTEDLGCITRFSAADGWGEESRHLLLASVRAIMLKALWSRGVLDKIKSNLVLF